MKRSGSPQRRTPLAPGGALKRVTPLQRTEWRRVVSEAVNPQPRRQRDTGPTRKTRDVVHARSGGLCEWPGCWRTAVQVHHRLGRKSGGRKRQMRDQLNGAAWLVDICAHHHEVITDAHGETLAHARATGWVLTEFVDGVPADATNVPLLTRHDAGPVLLDGVGGWHPVE